RVPTGEYAYVGWAPMGPEFIWVNGAAVIVYWPPPYYWVFCPSPYAFDVHVGYYMVRDRPLLRRLGYNSRYYTAAQPRPHARTPASPTPAAARVPPSALPRERVSLQPVPAGFTRARIGSRERLTYDRSNLPADVTRSRPARAALPAGSGPSDLSRVPVSPRRVTTPEAAPAAIAKAPVRSRHLPVKRRKAR
ncbi:MAG TPA: hypothetical protein VGP93_12690, partial [Polyangiaceae bacterium]|nr:hypothetical protein [Polyangiaceae bacterium]